MLNKLTKWLSLVLLATVAGLGFADTRPLLVTSIHPMTLIAGDLADDWLEVKQLLADNQEPHHVSLSISQRRLLENADLVLWVGEFMEGFLVRGMAALPDEKQISMQKALSQSDNRFEDPHYWLDPAKVRVLYRALAAKLIDRFPERQSQIENRLADALNLLDTGVARARASLAPGGSRKIVVDHQAYGHLREFLGIEILGALTDERGAALGARGFAGLMGQPEVDCVVVEQLPPVRGAVKLAKHYNRPIVEIDPLGRRVPIEEGYAGFLRDLSLGFQRCFGGP